MHSPARLLSIAVLATCSSTCFAAQYDLIVRNGWVIDGTGAERVKADVAIDDGKIVAVGTLAADDSADRTIDASGLIVAPGFIDVHTHVDDDIYTNPLAENFVRDGVTTIVSGNCGSSVRDVGEFFERVGKNGSAVNNATLYGLNTVVLAIKGASVDGKLTPDQLSKGRTLVEQAMSDGAIGFSSGLIYKPGMWCSTEEIVELAKPAGARGGVYATHMRSESTEIMEAIDEALRIGSESGCRVQISHFKLSTVAAVNKFGRGTKVDAASDLTLAKVNAARDAGQEVWLDQYPYTASSTGLTQMLPDWIFENGPAEAKKILQDEKQLPKVLADMKRSHETVNKRKDLSYAVVASASGRPELAGKSIKQVAQMRTFKQQHGDQPELMGGGTNALPAGVSEVEVSMDDQYRAIIDIHLGGGASMIYHGMDEIEVTNILKSPIVGIASDSGIRVFGAGMPHPRGYGTNARILGRYVRELKVISLEDAVRKMTSLPAHSFRMAGRGTIKPGNFADVTVFDEATIADKSTFESPHQYAVGVRHVLVNGVEVFDGERMTGARSGMPVFGPAKRSN